MQNIIHKLCNLPLAIQFLLSIISFLFYGFASAILEKSYLASQFPVPYFIGQTSFDAEKIKVWYQFMINKGTFGIYLQTQFIDFVFILSVILAGFFIWTLLANLHSKNSFFRTWGYVLAFALPLAGFFDSLENLVSFFMIAYPKDFPSSIVFIYSSFATIKFGFWLIALVWATLSILALPIAKINNWLQNKISIKAI